MVSWNGQYFDVNNEKHSVQINVLQELIEIDPVDGMRHCIPGLRYTEFLLDGKLVSEEEFARLYPLLHDLATPRESRKATQVSGRTFQFLICVDSRDAELSLEAIQAQTRILDQPYCINLSSIEQKLLGYSFELGDQLVLTQKAFLYATVEQCAVIQAVMHGGELSALDRTGKLYSLAGKNISTVQREDVPVAATCRWCRGTGIVQGLRETYPCLECQTK